MPPVRRRSTSDRAIGLAFVGGAVTGALAVALAVVLIAGLLSPLPAGVRYGLAIALSVTVLAVDREIGGLRLPQSRRQIPPQVVAARRPSSAWRFALVYGTGLFTYLPTAAPHLLVIWLALVTTTPTILLSGAAFGVGRGVPLLARAVSFDRVSFQRALERTADLMRPVAAPALLVLCGFVGWPF